EARAIGAPVPAVAGREGLLASPHGPSSSAIQRVSNGLTSGSLTLGFAGAGLLAPGGEGLATIAGAMRYLRRGSVRRPRWAGAGRLTRPSRVGVGSLPVGRCRPIFGGLV